jgi:hypothetical protein
MEFSALIPGALCSLYVGISNIAYAERICAAYRRWGVEEWLAEPKDCRVAGGVAIAFSVVLVILPIFN